MRKKTLKFNHQSLARPCRYTGQFGLLLRDVRCKNYFIWRMHQCNIFLIAIFALNIMKKSSAVLFFCQNTLCSVWKDINRSSHRTSIFRCLIDYFLTPDIHTKLSGVSAGSFFSYQYNNIQLYSNVPTLKLLKPGEANKVRNITQASKTFEVEVWGGGGAWLF